MTITMLIVKHLIRLRNTLHRHSRMLWWQLKYGKQFRAKKFHFRDDFHLYIEKYGIVNIEQNVF